MSNVIVETATVKSACNTAISEIGKRRKGNTVKAIVGTHHYTDNNGHTYFGSIVGAAACNLVWFLPLCDDGITWMKEPVCVAGVVTNASRDPRGDSRVGG